MAYLRRPVLAATVCVAAIASGACGNEPATPATPAPQAQRSALLLPRPLIDLDGLFNDPATRMYREAAAEAGSPCRSVLAHATAAGDLLAPAIATKDHRVVATQLPELLGAMRALFACVQDARAGQAPKLPPAPAVPAYRPDVTPCVVAIWHGKSCSTCP